MKKIFTLVAALASISTLFAQRDYQRNQPVATSENRNYNQPGYSRSSNNFVYSENTQQQATGIRDTKTGGMKRIMDAMICIAGAEMISISMTEKGFK